MSTHDDCPVCLGPITEDNRGVKVTVRRRRSPKHAWLEGWKIGTSTAVACQSCASTAGAGEDGRQNLVSVRLQEFVEDFEPKVCEQCGLPILLKPDKRRKRDTCSEYCRLKLAKAGRSVPTSVTHCEVCGAEVEGRAGRKTCSSACRQKAYRDRARA